MNNKWLVLTSACVYYAKVTRIGVMGVHLEDVSRVTIGGEADIHDIADSGFNEYCTLSPCPDVILYEIKAGLIKCGEWANA